MTRLVCSDKGHAFSLYMINRHDDLSILVLGALKHSLSSRGGRRIQSVLLVARLHKRLYTCTISSIDVMRPTMRFKAKTFFVGLPVPVVARVPVLVLLSIPLGVEGGDGNVVLGGAPVPRPPSINPAKPSLEARAVVLSAAMASELSDGGVLVVVAGE